MSLENMDEGAVRDMAQVYHDLVNNPQTREMMLRATKKVNPTLNIPELELKDQVNGLMKMGTERISSLENQLNEYKIRDEVIKRRQELKKEHRFNDDDIEEVEKLMVDRKIADHKTAADFFKMQKQQAVPTPHSPMTPVSLPQDSLAAMNKGGQTGLNQWARGEAMKSLDDLIRQRA
jgi:hypothetical protein